MSLKLCLFLSVILTFLGTAAPPDPEDGFYERPALFSTRPSADTEYVQTIDRFGPVGIGIALHPPAFVMKVKNVEPGSPAAVTGQLSAGQIIDRINGETLRDIDPRIQLGNIITKAEAADGLVILMIRDDEQAAPKKVVVKLPVLGAYSETWPLDCPKSDAIVRNLADHLAEGGWDGDIGMQGPKMLFLLSTGEEKDLEVVRNWIGKTVQKNQNYRTQSAYQWHVGWGAPPIAEYYLRTGDKSVLPLMARMAAAVRNTMYHDGWGGRGLAGHHMGIAGTPTLTFLLLARQCGVEVDEDMLQRALRHYYRYAGRGVNPYPDIRPENTFTDNGRVALLGYSMAAAAALRPKGENSIYAGARDICAIKSFYSTSYMLHGHTGGGIGEVWRSAAMALLNDKKPAHYREFMKQRQWFYEMSRRYDGSFGILGGSRYDKTSWGAAMGLTYTAPRKKLCIFGAPRSAFAEYHAIPERPWGTRGDDAFCSLEVPVGRDGTARNLDDETLASDTGLAVDQKVADPKITDAELLKYIYHPEHRFREVAAQAIFKYERYHLIPALLKDKDPRIRNAGVMAIKAPRRRRGAIVPGFPMEKMTTEMKSLLFGMLNDPEESWFTVDKILNWIQWFPVEELAPHIPRIIYFMQRDESWLRQSALNALIPLALDERYYQSVLPAIAKNAPNFIRSSSLSGLRSYAQELNDAPPELQAAGRDLLGQIYLAYPGTNADPPGGLHPASEAWYLDSLARALAAAPGGLEKLYAVSRKRFPGTALPHSAEFLGRMNRGEALEGALKQALANTVKDELIPAHVGRNRKSLQGFIQNAGATKGRAMAELLRLYEKIGNTDYAWRAYGPKRNEMEWFYYSFDPPEKWTKADDRLGRFRPVTFPEETENWFVPDFDPADAGWERGPAPFGAADGKKRTLQGGPGCDLSFCGCDEPINTLWEKDVLLLRGTFSFPKLEEGYAYRLLHGGISHVGAGGGYRLYVNGKLFIDSPKGVDRRAGAKPIGRVIPKDLWPEFNRGEVTLSVITFKKHHPRNKAYGGNIMISMERMKLPTLSDELIRKSATVIPMLSSDWQEIQDPDSTTDNPDEGKFVYDGTFVANQDVLGNWQVIRQVDDIDDFDPAQPIKGGFKPAFRKIRLKGNGKTDRVERIWSGSTLMDLDRYQALKMVLKTINGQDYLFIEAGGFSDRRKPGWSSPWLVLKRQ